MRAVNQPWKHAFALQQDVQAIDQFSMARHDHAFEYLEQHQLGIEVELHLLAGVAHCPALRVGTHRQALGIKCWLCGQHRKALPQQEQWAGSAECFASCHFVQHDIAVDVGVFDQRHRLERGGVRFLVGLGRVLEARHLHGQRIKKKLGELFHVLAEHPQLRIDVGLDLAVVGQLRAFEHRALQLDGGQLQRRAQDFIGGLEDAFQQVTHAGRYRRAGDPCHGLAC